jgi:hypothetical protein
MCNSAVERMNSVIGQSIRAYCADAKEAWPYILPSIMAGYRFSPAINSTGYSPFFMLFGREPQMPIDNILDPIPQSLPQRTRQDLRELLDNLEMARHIAKANTLAAQGAYKERYDRKAKTPLFAVGQKVWLKRGNYQPFLSRKLQRKWIGPYFIVFAYATPNYLLRECGTNKPLKSSVHANRLRPYTGEDSRPLAMPLNLPDTDVPQVMPTESQATPHGASTWDEDDDLPLSVLSRRWSKAPDTSQSAVDVQGQQIEKLLNSKCMGGVQHFKVKFKDDSMPKWVSKSAIPEIIVQDYYSRCAWKGRLIQRKKREKT